MATPPMDTQETAGFRARLFDASGLDRDLGLAELASIAADEHTLAWIDLSGDARAHLPDVLQRMGLPSPRPWESGTNPALGKHGGVSWLRVVAVNDEGRQEDVRGTLLTLIAARNVVVSLHESPLAFMDELRSREDRDSMVGTLSSESFVASLLDRQLSTYFDAVTDFELAVERLEVQILEERGGACLPELRRLRRWASRLRRMLAPHRVVFAALSRPDFQPQAQAEVQRHFEVLDQRFERAMDMVENARELVLGSFALFSSQNALQTNDSMRVLTFVTVITGVLATLVGALGMNFAARFFDTGDTGFWMAIGGLLLVAGLALGLARWRRWI